MKITEANVKEHLNEYLKTLLTNNDGIILTMFVFCTLHHKFKEFYDYEK